MSVRKPVAKKFRVANHGAVAPWTASIVHNRQRANQHKLNLRQRLRPTAARVRRVRLVRRGPNSRPKNCPAFSPQIQMHSEVASPDITIPSGQTQALWHAGALVANIAVWHDIWRHPSVLFVSFALSQRQPAINRAAGKLLDGAVRPGHANRINLLNSA